MSVLQAQGVELEKVQCLGEEILASCHPDSIITLKSWISVTKTRYDEVGAFVNHNKLDATGDQMYDKPAAINTRLCLKTAHLSLSFFSESGSDLGPAAGAENPGKPGSTGRRKRGSSEASGVDLVSRGIPQPPRSRASA